MLPRERVDAIVNGLDERRIKLAGQSDGHQRRRRGAGHRRDIAQAAAEGFVADLLRSRGGRKMDAFDHRIGLEQQQPIRQPEVEHGAIISRTDDD